MQDGIIKGTGNSRYLKTMQDALARWPTWEDALREMIAGTFPFDLNGINPAGWKQIGTAMDKTNLLTDTTAAAIKALSGTTPDTPNDAFAALSAITGERAKIQTGSYEGTGTYGKDTPCSITFDFAPELVIVFVVNKPAATSTVGFPTFFKRGIAVAKTWDIGHPTGGNAIVNWDGNTLSWYVSSTRGWAYNVSSATVTDRTAQQLQLNDLGTTYSYIANG